MKRPGFVALLAILALGIVSPVWAGTTYDFDSCSPVLTPGMSTPLVQTCGGIYAYFSSTHDGLQGGGYSVQTDVTTGWHMSQFSANYLMPNGLDPGRLDVSFGQSLTAITFTFATADFHQNEVPTTIQMDAYLDSTLVGSQQAHGEYGSDTMPMGTLTFNSGGAPFNRIEIWIPWQPLGSSDVLVDNIAVTPGGNVGMQFRSVPPCRLVDTRSGNPIPGNSSQDFIVPQLGGCNVPATATAYSLNVTVVPHGPLNYLTIWPTGQQRPVVSTMNSPDGRFKANAAIVPAGTGGAVSVYVTDTADVVLDVNGYFAPAAQNTTQFFPLTPCRVVDTRDSNQPQGLGPPSLTDMEIRDLPILASTCLHGITNPQAYSFNVTVVPVQHQPLNYLTVWPSDQQQPFVSTLNNPSATVVANGAIVPAAANTGNIKVFAYNATELVMDINGYFATPGQGGYSFYPASPCRALDTRLNGQPFSGLQTVNVAGGPCALPIAAAAYVFNATVVPSGFLDYLTLWPDGQVQPLASTLNAYDGLITSNMGIIPTTNGWINAYASQLTHLVLDISGYFAQ